VGCPIEIPSGQTPGSSLDAYAVEGERARKKKEVIKVTELRSICRGISIRKRSACMHTYICARARPPCGREGSFECRYVRAFVTHREG